jgi:thymidylate synthase (FAD)
MTQDRFQGFDPMPNESLVVAVASYEKLLQLGVAPEMARMVLPQSMMTEWIWSGTLGAFADMLRLRLDPHTQYESRIVAKLIYPEIEKRFPVSIKALLGTT